MGSCIEPGSSRSGEIREQLERILADPAFSGANRRSRLLRYLVEETLQGRGEAIKESVIAAEVFDRSPDYDPQVDSVVRVEIGRLRSRLAEYYDKAGGGEPVRIEIPKGAYRPVFVFREQPVETKVEAKAPAPARYWLAWSAGAGAIVLAAVFLWHARGVRETKPASIAVLPFLNLSGNSGDEYLSDGISDELTEDLAEFNNLHVVARTSAFQYKGKSADVREIGRNLLVGAVLEGSVARHGESLHVIAQLIRSSDGYHLWSKTYDGTLADLPALEAAIAVSTREALVPSAAPAPAATRTAWNPEAHDLYIRAVYQMNLRTADSTREAIDLARQAAEKDASFAQPWVLMAAAEAQLTTLFAQPADVSAKHEWDDVQRALALDPQNSTAHAIKALLAYTDHWDWPQAEQEFRLAIASGSHSAAESLYGWCLMTRGRFEESRRRLQMASDLDPLSLGPQLNQVEEWIAERNFPEAKRKLDSIVARAPSNPTALSLQLALAWSEKDCAAADAADARLRAAYSRTPRIRLSTIAADSACGRADRVAANLADIVSSGGRDFPYPYLVASAFAHGNDVDHAISFLELSAMRHEPSLMELRIDAAFDPIRKDPRLIALEKKLGLLE